MSKNAPSITDSSPGPFRIALALRLLAWRRRPRLRLSLYALLLLAAVGLLARRSISYAEWSAAGPPAATPGATPLWFRPVGDTLTPLEGTPSPDDLAIVYQVLSSVRSTTPERPETIQVAVRVLSVQPREAEERAEHAGLDLPVALARLHFWQPELKTSVIRDRGDPSTVILRFRDAARFRANATKHLAELGLPLGFALAALVALGESLAAAGPRVLPTGHCARCGYSLGELAICPECGRSP